MYLHECGPTDAPGILFIHGAGVAGWMWKPQLADLSQDYHCLVPDLPGHGQNPADEVFSLEGSVEDIAEIIRQHVGRAHVVGLSMGGTVAIGLLAEYPELVNHVMISAPPIGPMPRHLLLLVRLLAPFTSLDFLIKQNAKAMNIPNEDRVQFRQNQKRLTAPVVKQINNAIHTFRLPHRLSDIHVPTLVMVGEKELGINFRAARQIARMMPNAVGRVAPGVGHGWNGENASLFNRTIRAWINHESLPEELLPLEDHAY